VQAAFTPPEVKELGELAGADVIVDPADLELDDASERELAADQQRAGRNLELLREYSRRTPDDKPRRLVMRFLASPVSIVGDERVEGIEVVRNELVEENGRIVARPTGETEMIPCGLVLRSVGYKGVPLPGVPFDEQRGTMPNDTGRVQGAERTYCAGWIKRGPSGVIGTNKKDATETIELLLADARAGRLTRAGDTPVLERVLSERGVDFVEYAGWQAIDAAERSAGEPLGRPRVKLHTWDKLLHVGRRGS
jgi:ferredoxin--NADP+ reductase